MNTILHTLDANQWNKSFTEKECDEAIKALEEGKIIFLPQLAHPLQEEQECLLTETISDNKTKNVNFNVHKNLLKGINKEFPSKQTLTLLLKNFANQSTLLIKNLFPDYNNHLQIGRTSFRPVEIKGRKAASYKKDDTRLHVDAFPANPNQGRRILRVFSNINHQSKARVWRIGQHFEEVARTFLPHIHPPFPLSKTFLKLFRITKSLRTTYDHIMLNIHDRMKADMTYQSTVPFREIHFPAQSTWIVYTDHVSHSALAGQHLLEQTFYLPVEAMRYPTESPIRILETLTQCTSLNR